jgi:hypothetical protein
LAQIKRAFLNLTSTKVVQYGLLLFLVRRIPYKITTCVFLILRRKQSPVCTCQDGAETLIARSPAKSLHDMRIRALKTHSCPTVPTSSRSGLDFGSNYAPPSIFTICPRPAICRRCVCCFSSAQQSLLDLARELLAPPAYRAYVCRRAQQSPTWCSAHGE